MHEIPETDGARFDTRDRVRLEVLEGEELITSDDEAQETGIVLGLGCATGALPDEVMSLAGQALEASGYKVSNLICIASLDGRRNEPALLAVAAQYRVPFVTFSATELEAQTPRLSEASSLVFSRTGCHGVAEAAALAAAGGDAVLIVHKSRSAHATAAVAGRARHWERRTG